MAVLLFTVIIVTGTCVFQGAHSDKLFCRIVSAAVGGAIRHSMDSSIGFRQQCYELLQVSSCLYRASMMIKTLYYPTDAQIYNSMYISLGRDHIQMETVCNKTEGKAKSKMGGRREE